MSNPKYQIYPSLLDSFNGYLMSGEVYDKYWGNSGNPPFSYEEFVEKQFQDLIGKINRVKTENVKADIGTVFNEIVDCIVHHRKSEIMQVYKVLIYGYVDPFDGKAEGDVEYIGKVIGVKAIYNGRTFTFPIDMCLRFAELYKGGGCASQVFVEGEIDTSYGSVRLYGYVDELMPMSIHDIKTTGMYEPWKFKGNNQHLVYTYCLRKMGNDVSSFVYDIALIKSNVSKDAPSPTNVSVSLTDVIREEYNYNSSVDEAIIRERCERFIEFLEANRHLITDKKIFCEVPN